MELMKKNNEIIKLKSNFCFYFVSSHNFSKRYFGIIVKKQSSNLFRSFQINYFRLLLIKF